MKSFWFTLLVPGLLSGGSLACKTDDKLIQNGTIMENHAENKSNTTLSPIKVRIGSRTFTAILFNNPTSAAFKALLPLTIPMSELNGNEKLYHFNNNLPTNAANPGTIHAGDLMIYGSNTLVLFYKSFPTTYSYTKLGQINDTAGLAAALGSGNVSVTFELE